MSIELMISEHPQVGENYNPSLGAAVKSAIDSAAICNSCADACLAEAMDMAQCIRTCLDCSDICAATARVAMRRTGTNRLLIRNQLTVCIEACDICAAECAQHNNPHCARCARMCQECSQACRSAIESLDAEIGTEF